MQFPVAVWTKFSQYDYISVLCPVRSVGFFQCCRRIMILRVKKSTRAEPLAPNPEAGMGRLDDTQKFLTESTVSCDQVKSQKPRDTQGKEGFLEKVIPKPNPKECLGVLEAG